MAESLRLNEPDAFQFAADLSTVGKAKDVSLASLLGEIGLLRNALQRVSLRPLAATAPCIPLQPPPLPSPCHRPSLHPLATAAPQPPLPPPPLTYTPLQVPLLDFSQITSIYGTGEARASGAALRALDPAALSSRVPQANLCIDM